MEVEYEIRKKMAGNVDVVMSFHKKAEREATSRGVKLQRLQRILGYEFRQPDYLRQALTHRSAGTRNNERLEFLGDAILGFEVAEILYRKHPDAAEGELSRARSQLVKRETLASVARRLGLGEYLILGTGELASGGQNRDSILSDAVEAIIAAVYLDGGMEQARAFVRSVLEELIDKSEPRRATQG